MSCIAELRFSTNHTAEKQQVRGRRCSSILLCYGDRNSDWWQFGPRSGPVYSCIAPLLIRWLRYLVWAARP